MELPHYFSGIYLLCFAISLLVCTPPNAANREKLDLFYELHKNKVAYPAMGKGVVADALESNFAIAGAGDLLMVLTLNVMTSTDVFHLKWAYIYIQKGISLILTGCILIYIYTKRHNSGLHLSFPRLHNS